MAYDNTNSGFIGKNQRKQSETHPDITGSVNVEGREFWINGWKNAKGYGLRLKPKDGSAPIPKDAPPADLDDPVPF